MSGAYDCPEREGDYYTWDDERTQEELARAELYAFSEDELAEIRRGHIPTRVMLRMQRDQQPPRTHPATQRIPCRRRPPHRGEFCWEPGCDGIVTDSIVECADGRATTICSAGCVRSWRWFEHYGWVAQATLEEVFS